MSISRNKAQLIAGIPLGLSIMFQAWVFFFKTSFNADSGERILLLSLGALLLMGPFIWAYVLLRRKDNPLISLTVTLPAAVVYFLAFIIEFLQPYRGGGASMIYAVAWAYAFIASGLSFFIFKEIIKRKFEIRK